LESHPAHQPLLAKRVKAAAQKPEGAKVGRCARATARRATLRSSSGKTAARPTGALAPN